MTADFDCPGLSYPLDVIVINDTRSRRPEYEIPRSCLEAMGITTDDIPPGGASTGGGVWFSREQADRARAHRHTRIYNDSPGIIPKGGTRPKNPPPLPQGTPNPPSGPPVRASVDSPDRIERLAQAAFEAHREEIIARFSWETIGSEARQTWRAMARAMLAAGGDG